MLAGNMKKGEARLLTTCKVRDWTFAQRRWGGERKGWRLHSSHSSRLAAALVAGWPVQVGMY
jgi:hypothetical protein